MKKTMVFLIMTLLFIPLAVTDARGNDAAGVQAELAALRSQFNEMKMSYEIKINQLEMKMEDFQKTYSIRMAKP